MKKNIVLLIIIVLTTHIAYAHMLKQADTILILKNANVLSSNGKKFLMSTDVEILNGKILRIGKSAKIKPGSNVMDLSGKYVIPGLIDAHVHVTAKYKNNIENTFSNLEYFLRHGITTVRDAAGNGEALLTAQTAIRKGQRYGADVFFASFMAGDWYYNRGQNIHNEPYTPWEQRLIPGDDLDKAMAEAKACGATGVKLYHSFDKDFLKEIVRAAKRHHLKVWAHTMLYPAKPMEVVEAGVEVLSHVSMLEVLKTDTLFYRRTTTNAYKDSVVAAIDIIPFCRAMKAHHAILDATLCVSADRDPWVFPLLKHIHEQRVAISAGTDQIVDLKQPYPRLVDELHYFTNQCGFTTVEALRSATMISARVIGQEKNIGSLEKGKNADIVVLTENPLLNIDALKTVDRVIQKGKVL